MFNDSIFSYKVYIFLIVDIRVVSLLLESLLFMLLLSYVFLWYAIYIWSPFSFSGECSLLWRKRRPSEWRVISTMIISIRFVILFNVMWSECGAGDRREGRESERHYLVYYYEVFCCISSVVFLSFFSPSFLPSFSPSFPPSYVPPASIRIFIDDRIIHLLRGNINYFYWFIIDASF